MTLEGLYKIIENRKKNLPENSHIASLFRDGRDRLVQKVGEEAVEVVIAAKNKKRKEIISETADLLFHILVMLSQYEITVSDIMRELGKRNRDMSKKYKY